MSRSKRDGALIWVLIGLAIVWPILGLGAAALGGSIGARVSEVLIDRPGPGRTIGWYAAGLAVPALCLLAFGRRAFRAARQRRIGASVAWVVAVPLACLVVPLLVWIGNPALKHDEILDQLKASICSGPLPDGHRIVSCSGNISHPFNGNQCGYEFTVDLERRLSAQEIRDFYEKWDPPRFEVRPSLQFIPPQPVDYVAGRTVRMLLIGDDEGDLRCS